MAATPIFTCEFAAKLAKIIFAGPQVRQLPVISKGGMPQLTSAFLPIW